MRDLRTMRVAALYIMGVVAVAAQSPPRIEVASVKESHADPSKWGFTTGRGRIHGENVTLKRCIMSAWSVGPNQIVGGPDWLNIERFEIEARADQPVESDAVLMTLLQGILAGRFNLVLHHETRPIEAYLLEMAKNGPKMEKAAGGANRWIKPTTAASIQKTRQCGISPRCSRGIWICRW